MQIIMELNHGTHKASKFAPDQDVISRLPDNVISNILNLLPLQDAVRTGILSRKWRFKWTMLTQLILDENLITYLIKVGQRNHFKIISRVLYLLSGAITKFVLFIDRYGYFSLDFEDVNHWLLFLSRKGIKDLTIVQRHKSIDKLPTHLFSCLELKHLKLSNCSFHPPTTFHGFPNLLSLELSQVQFARGKFGELFTLCPLLEILNMNATGVVKLDDIAKLANLKTLSLSMYCLENTTITSTSSTIFELLDFLPKLQELNLDFQRCKLIQGGAEKRFPTAFPSLKALKLSEIDFGSAIMLSCVSEMIRHLPNLQTLEIIAASVSSAIPTPTICFSEIDYNPVGSSQLQSAVFLDLKGSENEACLIKCLLKCSPFLKMIGIHLHRPLFDGHLMFATKLLKLKGSYPEVEINLY
ncbi:hypothetical protein M8C21_006048 [Ambrosia artemisiifolia]|uniref:F-box domain-containing protein n=1 Tax=Ambrosia artemisiifolia TaxID=4212 RepID=A0AAD5GTA0_AMBAR|nr:hypothetical protein M8C21_006048 [Ambrosia artemisiifolia]